MTEEMRGTKAREEIQVPEKIKMKKKAH